MPTAALEEFILLIGSTQRKNYLQSSNCTCLFKQRPSLPFRNLVVLLINDEYIDYIEIHNQNFAPFLSRLFLSQLSENVEVNVRACVCMYVRVSVFYILSLG